MTSSKQTFRAAALLAALLFAGEGARADGLADLKSALARLAARTPVRVALDVRTDDRHGEGGDAEEKSGQASVLVEDGARGLQVTYAKDTLARMDTEARLSARDKKAKTPTLWALGKLDVTEYAPMISASSSIARALDEAEFRSEKDEAWQGKPARLLNFSIKIDRLSIAARKYVKQFDGSYDIWIAADGTPLASALRTNASGRAFVVVTFEAHEDVVCTYGVSGDRLLMLRQEAHNISSGAGERGEQRVVKTLQPLS